MWTVLKTLLFQFGVVRAVWAVLRALFVALPVAFLFKLFGTPLLILLAVVALPVLAILAVVGLPFLLVLVLGGGVMAVVFAVLAFGLTLLKVLLPFLLLFWVAKLFWRWFGGGRGKETPGGAEPKTAE